MKSTIFKITLIGLLSIPLFGCGDKKEEAKHNPSELKGACKEAYEQHLKMYDDVTKLSEKALGNSITKEEYEKLGWEMYSDADEKHCAQYLLNHESSEEEEE